MQFACLFISWMKPSRVLGLIDHFCLEGCDMTSGIWIPRSAPGIHTQMNFTMRKAGERKTILSIWQEKGAVPWVDAQPAREGVGERGFACLLTRRPLCVGTREWARVQLLAACPILLIQRGERCSAGKKGKHNDGVRAGEMRGGRMKGHWKGGGRDQPLEAISWHEWL